MMDEDQSIFSSPNEGSASSLATDIESNAAEDSYEHLKLRLKCQDAREEAKKRPHISKGLQDLLEGANKYTPQYGYSLPRSFLRDRSHEAKGTDEVDEKGGSDRKGTSSGSAVKVKTKKRRLPRTKLDQDVAKPRAESRKKVKNHLNNSKDQVSGGPRYSGSKNSGKKNQKRGIQYYFVDPEDSSMALLYTMFDVNYLRNNTRFEESVIPSTVLTPKGSHKGSQAFSVYLQSLLFPDFQEEYCIDFSSDTVKYDPMTEIGKIIEYSAIIYVPQPHSDVITKKILPQLNSSIEAANAELFVRTVEEYNQLIRAIPRNEIIQHLSTKTSIPRSFIHDLLHIVYTRSILPSFRKLKEYEAFSSYVYGELLPGFLSDVYSKCDLKPDYTFMDLGSGVGNCVVQVALEYGCKLSFGCEIMPNASLLTEKQLEELKRRCTLFGLKLSPVEFSLRESFVNNRRVDELIPKCDVILINNFLFDSNLNRDVEKIIQNAKVGSKIISLKNLRGQGYSISFFNMDSILNRLHVERFDLKEGSVSWTHNGGEYYISTVLPDIDESLFDPSERKRNTKRPKRYTR